MSAGSERRILVVEDSHLVQRMVRETFEGVGYQVEAAGNGQEALVRIRAHPPEVIISDIVMPVMDGWELCEEVRRQPATADIPFLFVTAVREVPERVRALRLGADDYITKPFSREELLARVERMLARSERLRVERADGSTRLTGHTSHLSVTDLLQLLSMNGKTGALLLTDASGRRGRVFLREGRVIDASLGEVSGSKALFRLLGWEEARFELDPVPEMPLRETLSGDTAGLLMEAAAQADELRAVLERLPALATRYRAVAHFAEVAGELELPVEDKAVLAEFALGAGLGEVLDRSALPDLRLADIFARLLDRRLLLPA